LLSQPNDMDYDPYDALLHHVYQQVRCFNLCSERGPILTLLHLNRLKERHGSGLQKKLSQQVSVFGWQLEITAFFRTTRCYWLPLKLRSDCSIQSSLLKSVVLPCTPHSVQCKNLSCPMQNCSVIMASTELIRILRSILIPTQRYKYSIP
jgi:hypothetical protein